MVTALEHQAILDLPKTELHIHIEGTLEPELALELAARNGITLPWSSLEELRAQYDFVNLQSFLDLYYQLMSTLRTPQDFRDLMLAYLEHAHHDGILHAEIFFDPQVHINNGLEFDTVMDGLLEGLSIGRERYGITGGLIACIVRDLPVSSAMDTLKALESRREDLLGIGLDSAEVGYPPSLFTEVFSRARELGLHVVAHAGEEGPASYVIEALDLLQVERIDHGIRCSDDQNLMHRIASSDIALTSCPLSNRRLQVVQDLRELPLHQFLEGGIRVTVNSDDPAYFGGYLAANYEALIDSGYSLQECAAFCRNGIEASFIDNRRQAELIEEYDRWCKQYLSE